MIKKLLADFTECEKFGGKVESCVCVQHLCLKLTRREEREEEEDEDETAGVTPVNKFGANPEIQAGMFETLPALMGLALWAK